MSFELKSLRVADPEMKRIVHLAGNVAASKVTVLISGESGSGKEMLARFIHEMSPRASRRLISLNCAVATPESLTGELEFANQSTLVLDEVGELPLNLQAKLLSVVQGNVRLIATASRDLGALVRGGQFREDLYYRLNVIPLNIPALRKRPRDIEELARFFTEVSGLVNGRVKILSNGAMEKLRQYGWPGNVRELENVIERSVLASARDEISEDDVFLEMPPASGTTDRGDLHPGMTIEEAERRLIMKTLEHTSQNRTQAARLLGISIRTLRNKLHEYGVTQVGAHEER